MRAAPHHPPRARGVTIAAVEFGTAWNLQGDPRRASFVAEVPRILGLPLPLAPNASEREAGAAVLGLGPRSWLFATAPGGTLPVDFDSARAAVNAAGGALFDVSSSYLGWTIAGEGAARVLNGGSPLDFDPRVFPAGHCAQSLLGHVGALFYRPDEAPGFVVLVARSFAADARELLYACAQGEGYRIVPPVRFGTLRG